MRYVVTSEATWLVMSTVLLALFAGESCEPYDDDDQSDSTSPVVRPTVTPDPDLDNDGYWAGVDCNDTLAVVNPGATEMCDGIDNDCDGLVDEEDAADAQIWYADSDLDHFGDADLFILACARPDGYVSNDLDCNDANPSIRPGAEEVCDGIDNDCDGVADNAPVDGYELALDADGDGFGKPDSWEKRCTGLNNEWDCDDNDPSEPVVVDVSATAGGLGTLAAPLTSIQDAIEQANRCVRVSAGIYHEALNFGGRDLDVLGIDGPDLTTIDAYGLEGPVVTFMSGESDAARLEGFTLKGGSGLFTETIDTYACNSGQDCRNIYRTYSGGGIYIDGATPTLRDLVVINNMLPQASSMEGGARLGGGGLAGGGEGPENGVIGSQVGTDEGQIRGGDREVDADELPVTRKESLESADIIHVSSFGGGIMFIGTSITLDHVYLMSNSADQGGGAYIDEGSTVDFRQSMVVGNTAAEGGAFLVDLGTLILTNVLTAWNVAAEGGGSVLLLDATCTELNVTHGRDDAPDGLVGVLGVSAATVMNSIIFGAQTAAGLAVDPTATLAVSYNNIYGNLGGEYEGITDPTGSEGNISADPMFTNVSVDGNPGNDDWTLSSESPSIDAGNPSWVYRDADNTLNDQGAFGGPDSDWDE